MHCSAVFSGWLHSCGFDMAFGVSSLQGEKPTIVTILRANQLLKQFQQDCNFELIFGRLIFAKCGIMVVSDAALGNVTLEGSTDAAVTSKVYSQACYFCFGCRPFIDEWSVRFLQHSGFSIPPDQSSVSLDVRS